MIKLPFPVPTNALYRNVRGRGRVRTTRYNNWREQAGWHLKTQSLIGETASNGPYSLDITFERPRNKDGSHSRRKRDLDNLVKAVSDLLVEHGVTPDDRLMQSITVRWSDAQDGPTVKVQAG